MENFYTLKLYSYNNKHNVTTIAKITITTGKIDFQKEAGIRADDMIVTKFTLNNCTTYQ